MKFNETGISSGILNFLESDSSFTTLLNSFKYLDKNN